MESLAPAALYLFSLFDQGISLTPDGNVKLSDDEALEPEIQTGAFQPDNEEVQSLLKKRVASAGLSELEELAASALDTLATLGAESFAGFPDNVQETLPSGITLDPASPSATRRRRSTDVALVPSAVSVQERGLGSFGIGLILEWTGIQGMIDELIDSTIRRICPVCGDVYDIYNKMTDPFWVVGQICEPCRPALQFREDLKIGEIVKRYAREVLDWYFKRGAYPPNGNPFPPPMPPPPPPIEAAQCVQTSFDLRLPQSSMLERSPGELACYDCGVRISRLDICGTVLVSAKEKKVLKAEFKLTADAVSNMDLRLRMNSVGRVKGSRAFGSDYTHGVDLARVFVIQ